MKLIAGALSKVYEASALDLLKRSVLFEAMHLTVRRHPSDVVGIMCTKIHVRLR